jgi:uncharacterized membrane protein YhdT
MIGPVIGLTAGIVASLIPKNPNEDVKRVNKILARMQLNKMLSRSGVSGDKTILSQKTSTTFDAYLATLTSYNIQEALIIANNSAASAYRKKKYILLMITVLVILAMSIFTGTVLQSIVIAGICVIDYIIDFMPNESIFPLIATVSSLNIPIIFANLSFTIIEMIYKDDKTIMYRMILYLLITCSLLLIF